jgi:YidC/Oxa1 family membrane protein insertase
MDYRLLGYGRQPGEITSDNRVLLLGRMAAGHDSLRVAWANSGPSRQELARLNLGNALFQLVEIPAGAKVEPPPAYPVKTGENLVFRTVDGDWELIKTFRFPGGQAKLADFTLAAEVEWRNLSETGQLLAYGLAGPAGLLSDDDSPLFGAVSLLSARQPSSASNGVEIERINLSDAAKLENMRSPDNRAGLAWIGAKNRFFAALLSTETSRLADANGAERNAFPGSPALFPAVPGLAAALKSQPQATTGAGSVPVFGESLLLVEPGAIGPGQAYRASYLIYAGPLSDSFLESADPRFQGVISYGFITSLDFISRWLVGLLSFLDSLIGNYGLAIIAVTIIFKLLLHPLNRKSYVSMNKMSKLAPQMKEIQKKYANDRVRLQQEMSRFYKEHGVSMAGGCLPMLLQLPIFFALYGAFAQGFSMRHAAFISGWIDDLSKPDVIYDLGWSIPLLNSPYISALPLIYLGLQILQMSLQPKPNDPQQAQQQKIMKFMPIVFSFMFYSMPAGLVLYFTVNALCSVGESWWMRNILLPRLGLGDSPAAAASASVGAQAGTGAAATLSEAAKRKRKRR